MVSAVEVEWVAPLIPKLNDEVDIDRLSGIKKQIQEEKKESTKTDHRR